MAVILFLLKAVGIILLTILLVLLLSAVLALFVPVRYELDGTVGERLLFHVKVSWLLRLLSVRFICEGKSLTSEIRIAGIRMRPKTKTQTSDKDAPTEDIAEDPDATGGTEQKKSGHDKTADDGEADSGRRNAPDNRKKNDDERNIQKPGTIEEREKIPDMGDNGLLAGIRRRVTGIRNTIQKIGNSLKNFKELILDETAKTAFGFLWSEFLFLFRHFKFRKIETKLTFSLGDPAWTGQALGILATIPSLYRYDIGIFPDFEADMWYVRGTFFAKGHAHLFHLLVSAIRLWRKKELRTFIKRLLK